MRRLQKIILFAKQPDQLSDELGFIQRILPYLPEGLVLERPDVGEVRERKATTDWMERDPELRDWWEVNGIGIYRVHTVVGRRERVMPQV